MNNTSDSHCKLCRAAQKKLNLKGVRCNSPKCAMVHNPQAPGFHGAKRKGKISQYGQQLAEKQRAKFSYGMREKQFRIFFTRAQKQGGDAGENLLKMLEMRFDNVVYRLGLASSRAAARQMVNHGQLSINKIKVDVASYIVKPGDVITIRPNKLKKKTFAGMEDKLKNAHIPGWLHNDFVKEGLAKVLHEPNKDDLDKSINSQAIVEFYSK